MAKKGKLVTGIIPALITPFTADDKVNVAVLPAMVEHFLDAGCTGLYLTGSTGSGVGMTVAERKQVTKAVCEATNGRAVVIVMVGACPVEDACELAKHAAECGASAISATVPGTYKWIEKTFVSSIDEAAAYFTKVAGATDLPFWPYWLGSSFSVSAKQFLDAMRNVPNFAGCKYTTTDMFTFQQIKFLSEQDKDGPVLTLVTGCDEMNICGMVMGSDGGIGSTYNVMPKLFVQLREAFEEDRMQDAMRLQANINQVVQLLIDVCKCGDRGTNIIAGIMCVLRSRDFDVGQPRAVMLSAPFTAQQEKTLLDGIAAMDFAVE